MLSPPLLLLSLPLSHPAFGAISQPAQGVSDRLAQKFLGRRQKVVAHHLPNGGPGARSERSAAQGRAERASGRPEPRSPTYRRGARGRPRLPEEHGRFPTFQGRSQRTREPIPPSSVHDVGRPRTTLPPPSVVAGTCTFRKLTISDGS